MPVVNQLTVYMRERRESFGPIWSRGSISCSTTCMRCTYFSRNAAKGEHQMHHTQIGTTCSNGSLWPTYSVWPLLHRLSSFSLVARPVVRPKRCSPGKPLRTREPQPIRRGAPPVVCAKVPRCPDQRACRRAAGRWHRRQGGIAGGIREPLEMAQIVFLDTRLRKALIAVSCSDAAGCEPPLIVFNLFRNDSLRRSIVAEEVRALPIVTPRSCSICMR
jgi:hypothetical protein